MTKNTAGVVALFLGGLGVHKFILGRPFQGILYLLFCWTYIPAIIALFESIKYFTMHEWEFDHKYYPGRYHIRSKAGYYDDDL